MTYCRPRYCTPQRRTVAPPFTVGCRYCYAAAGQQCINEITGEPLRRALAHPCRIVDSEMVFEDA